MKAMENAQGSPIDVGPKTVILGIWEATDLKHYQRQFVNLGCLVAKRDIVQKWGSERLLTLQEWEQTYDIRKRDIQGMRMSEEI